MKKSDDKIENLNNIKRFEDYDLNIIPSPIDTRDWIAETIHPKFVLDTSLDLKKDLQPIRDQGNQGSCAAQSGACVKEWQEKKDINFNEYMSPQFIYNLRENFPSSGMYLRDLMQILQKHGSVPERDFTYGGSNRLVKPSDKLLKKAKDYIVENYAQIKSMQGLKTALVQNGPCVIAVPVYHFGEDMWKPKEGFTEIQGGHALSIVGYNTKGFILRNSWGEDWGNSGYAIFPYEDWGLHWEVWTSIDAKSKEQPKIEKWKLTWYWIKQFLFIKLGWKWIPFILVPAVFVGYIIYDKLF